MNYSGAITVSCQHCWRLAAQNWSLLILCEEYPTCNDSAGCITHQACRMQLAWHAKCPQCQCGASIHTTAAVSKFLVIKVTSGNTQGHGLPAYQISSYRTVQQTRFAWYTAIHRTQHRYRLCSSLWGGWLVTNRMHQAITKRSWLRLPSQVHHWSPWVN